VQREAVPGTVGWSRVYFLVAQNNRIASIHFSNSLPQVSDEFIQRFIFSVGGEIAIEIANQANPDADIVQVIAVDVAAGQLFDPSVTDFDLAIPSGCAIADDKMIRESVFHPANVPVIIIEHPGASLPRPAVVDDDEFPARALDRRAADRVDVRGGEITIIRRLARERPPSPFHRRRRWRWFVALFLLKSGLFLMVSAAILYVSLAASYPAVHDTLHNFRHALAIVPCH